MAIPSWSFELTENAIASPAGSLERVISYNRMSYADYLLTSSAPDIAVYNNNVNTLVAQMAIIQAATTNSVGNFYKTAGAAPTGVAAQSYIELTGSGSTLAAKAIYRLMNLITLRTKPTTVLHFRGIGSGAGRTELGAYGESPVTVPAVNVQARLTPAWL